MKIDKRYELYLFKFQDKTECKLKTVKGRLVRLVEKDIGRLEKLEKGNQRNAPGPSSCDF